MFLWVERKHLMDHLILCGADYKQQPLVVRERLNIPSSCVSFALRELVSLPSIREAVLLSTCNRFEVYAVATDPVEGRRQINSFFRNVQRVADHDAIQPDYVLHDDLVARHLFRVAAGLESMVLGEGQIISQIKESYKTASLHQTAGTVLKRLFELALHCGKRVRSETTISRRAVSTGAAAIELAAARVGGWQGTRVLIIGAGRAGQMCLKQLLSTRHSAELTVLSRNAARFDQIRQLDRYSKAELSHAFENRHALAAQSDAVFVTTAAPDYVLTAQGFDAHSLRTSCIIDMSVPRNVDPAISAITDLITIDDLSGVVRHNLAERSSLCADAESIVKQVLSGRWRSRTERHRFLTV